MSGFMYFLPDRTLPIRAADLIEVGLAYAFDSDPAALRFTPSGSTAGPIGGGGVVVVDPERVTVDRMGFVPDQQAWRKVPGSPAWVGMWREDRPTQKDLIRQTVLPGELVKLGDGFDWLVPIVRGLVEEDDKLKFFSKLPSSSVLNDDGEWVKAGAMGEYQPLWEIADAWFAARAGTPIDDHNRQEFEFDGVHHKAVLMLRTNYVISDAESALLGLVNEKTVVEILDAAVEWRFRMEWFKKKLEAALDGTSTDSGPVADSVATVPAS